MVTLMRQMTVPCPDILEMNQYVKVNCGTIYNYIKQLKTDIDSDLLIDFVYSVLEFTGLHGTLPGIYQVVIQNLIDELIERGLFNELFETDMGKTWYGTTMSTYFSGNKIGKKIKHICKKRIEKIETM